MNNHNSQCETIQYIWKELTYSLQVSFFEGRGGSSMGGVELLSELFANTKSLSHVFALY